MISGRWNLPIRTEVAASTRSRPGLALNRQPRTQRHIRLSGYDGIAAAFCGKPKRPTNHPRENERAGCKSPHPHLS